MKIFINITDKEIEALPFLEHGYQTCDEEYYAWMNGIKWLRDRINEQ